MRKGQHYIMMLTESQAAPSLLTAAGRLDVPMGTHAAMGAQPAQPYVLQDNSRATADSQWLNTQTHLMLHRKAPCPQLNPCNSIKCHCLLISANHKPKHH